MSAAGAVAAGVNADETMRLPPQLEERGHCASRADDLCSPTQAPSPHRVVREGRKQWDLERQYSEMSCPPEAVLRGLENNYMCLDRRSWLEVRDARHRYGRNLREYYKAWDDMGKPGKTFFEWLNLSDYELPDIPRAVLNSDTVQYISEQAERERYVLVIEGNRVLHAPHAGGGPVKTGPDGWIFVLRNDVLYGRDKVTTPPRFHHSSFFAGEYVEAAGMLFTDDDGNLLSVYPHSGHYRPTNYHLHRLLEVLLDVGVDLHLVFVDAQRAYKVARQDNDGGGKRRKAETPFLVPALDLYYFLSVKHYAWDIFLFDELLKKAREWATRVGWRDAPRERHVSFVAAF